jgi:hypothetical protein
MSPLMVPTSTGDIPVCVTFDEDDEHVGSDSQLANDDHTKTSTDYTPSGVCDTPGRSTHDARPSTLINHHQSPSGKAPLPIFIAPLSTRIPSEDLDFLAQKGVFTVPGPDVRAEILRGYIFCVHPFMPILDLKAFIHSVVNEQEDGGISLLLFQAVMFAGLSSLELHFIHSLGFESTKQAREVFFNRVRLLYEFDVEPDEGAILQSLLLMSSWYGRINDRRHTWHWTGLALQSPKIWDSIVSQLLCVALIRHDASEGDCGGVCTFVIGCLGWELADQCVFEMRTST